MRSAWLALFTTDWPGRLRAGAGAGAGVGRLVETRLPGQTRDPVDLGPYAEYEYKSEDWRRLWPDIHHADRRQVSDAEMSTKSVECLAAVRGML